MEQPPPPVNIVLVCIGNFQDYILVNIRNLIQLNHRNIHVITDDKFKHHFNEFIQSTNDGDNVSLVKITPLEELTDIFHYYEKTNLDKEFRNGFWTLTSLRFFYIYALMNKYKLKNVVHIENDVVLYYNSDELLTNIDNTKIYVPFNSFGVNVACIVYIPNADLFGFLLHHYNMAYFDMRIFAYWKHTFPHLIEAFPIITYEHEKTLGEINPIQSLISSNFPRFNQIFDGNAMGQYLGGIDGRNVENNENTVGFVNAECYVKYNQYSFVWKGETGHKKPFIVLTNGEQIPIFNLHIHSKDLDKFVGGEGF
jgi:hypothetical protein